jgi:hypothetical protein
LKLLKLGDADIIDHAEKLTDLPDEHMAEILPALKKLAAASVSFQRSNTMQANRIGF